MLRQRGHQRLSILNRAFDTVSDHRQHSDHGAPLTDDGPTRQSRLGHFCLLLGFSSGQCFGCLLTVDGSTFFSEPSPAATAKRCMAAAAWCAAGDAWFDWGEAPCFSFAVAALAFGWGEISHLDQR